MKQYLFVREMTCAPIIVNAFLFIELTKLFFLFFFFCLRAFILPFPLPRIFFSIILVSRSLNHFSHHLGLAQKVLPGHPMKIETPFSSHYLYYRLHETNLGFISLFSIHLSLLCVWKLHASRALDFLFHLYP